VAWLAPPALNGVEYVRTAIITPEAAGAEAYFPADIAPAGGGLLLADPGQDRVAVLTGAGSVADIWGRRGQAPGQFDRPVGIAVDRALGRVYVADVGNRRVQVLSLDGRFVAEWTGESPALMPVAVEVAPDSDVYVLNAALSEVERWDADGTRHTSWAGSREGAQRLRDPVGLAVDSKGRVYVADNFPGRVLRFAPGPERGELESVWTAWRLGLPQASFERLTDLAVDGATDEVFVAGGRPARVHVISEAGVYVGSYAATNFPSPQGLDVAVAVTHSDVHGAVMLAAGALGSWRILHEDGAGGLQTLAEPEASVKVGFHRPSALSTDDGGRLVVLDASRQRATFHDGGGAVTSARYAPLGASDVAAEGAYLAFGEKSPGGGRLSVWSPEQGLVWQRACRCGADHGLAVAGNLVYATEPLTRGLASYSLDGWPTGYLRPPGARLLWPSDIDSAGGVLFSADLVQRTVQAWSEPSPGSHMPSRDWRVSQAMGPLRVSAADGDPPILATLSADGAVEVFTAEGGLVGRFLPQPVPGRGAVRPIDLAVGSDGRIFILDAESDSVLVYQPTGREAPTPTAGAVATPSNRSCAVRVDKRVSPGVLVLGETAQVGLFLQADCPPAASARADVVLVIDRSGSMVNDDKLGLASQAARDFVDGLDLTRHRIGVVSFGTQAGLDQTLTTDRASALAAIASLRGQGATDLAGAIDLTSRHLAQAARTDAVRVMLLMTDGRPTQAPPGLGPYEATHLAAGWAQARGIQMFTIGLGEDVDAELLRLLASQPEDYFFAPDATDLAAIYARLSRAVQTFTVSQLTVDDMLSPDVLFEPGSGAPAPAVAGRILRWGRAAVPAEGLRLEYGIRPTRAGTYGTNEWAAAVYTDGDGVRRRVQFPIPQITVLQRTPSPTVAPSPTATRAPLPALLPITLSHLCLRVVRHADAVLVMDTSSSMAGEKLAAAQDAAREFLGLLDLERDQAAVISFNATASLAQALTHDRAALEAAVTRLVLGRGTKLDSGLEAALTELAGPRRDLANNAVIVLVTDGRQEGDVEPVLRQAARGRAEGVFVFAVALGGDADRELLRRVAGDERRFFDAPGPDDLRAIYSQIAGVIPCQG
jgi:Mg-chelatase subunit ChlD/DNA-binding beta-propeller fold protein YncE